MMHRKKQQVKRGVCISLAGVLAVLPLSFSVSHVTSSALGAEFDDNDELPYSSEYLAPFYPFDITVSGFARSSMDEDGYFYDYVTYQLDHYLPPLHVRSFDMSFLRRWVDLTPLYRQDPDGDPQDYEGTIVNSIGATYRYPVSGSLSSPEYAFTSVTAFPVERNNVPYYQRIDLYSLSFSNKIIPVELFYSWLGTGDNDNLVLHLPLISGLSLQLDYTLYYLDGDEVKQATDSYSGTLVYIPAGSSEPAYNPNLVDSSGRLFFNSIFQNVDLREETADFYSIEDEFLYFGDFSLTIRGYYDNVLQAWNNWDLCTFTLDRCCVDFLISKDTLLSYENTLNTFLSKPVEIIIPASPIDNILNVVDNFFTMEIFPGFYVSYFLYIGVAGLIIGFAIKIFLQG